MLYITVPDMNDSVSSVTIAEKEYLIRFTYNGTGDFWSFGLSDTDENPIISPTKTDTFYEFHIIARWNIWCN